MQRLHLLFAAAMAAVTACNDGAAIRPDGQAKSKVTVQKIAQAALPEEHAFTGNVEGERRVNLSTKIMGQILSIPCTEGMPVTAGQTVVRIKSDDISAKRAQVRANLIEAEAALKNVETNYNRVKSLYVQKSATQKEMDDVEMSYRMAQARVEAVKEMEKEVTDVIGYGDVISPIQGYVTKKFAHEGDMAVPGMPLITIEDLSVLKVMTQVPESEIHLFRTGDEVKILIDALNGKEIKGSVDQINPGGNPMSRQFEVKVIIKNISAETRGLLKSGMFARVLLTKGSKTAITVPENVIIRRGQLEGLYVVSNGNTAMLRWIRTGKMFGDRVEILSGLDDGETIVTSSETKLTDGIGIEVAP